MVEESRYFSSSGPLPGHILALIISTITGEAPCHECSSRIETMNENGWLWCWRNRTLIAKWLVDEAAKRGHKIGHNKALALILAAFRTVMSDKKALTRHAYQVEATDHDSAIEKAKTGKNVKVVQSSTTAEQYTATEEVPQKGASTKIRGGAGPAEAIIS